MKILLVAEGCAWFVRFGGNDLTCDVTKPCHSKPSYGKCVVHP